MTGIEDLADDIGFHYEALGLSRTAGRALGNLLLSPTGSADAVTLAEQLGVAKSSLSVALNTLVRYGLVTRRAGSGRRTDYLIADDAFQQSFLAKSGELGRFADLARRGLDLVDADSDAGRRIARMEHFYAFMMREFPALLDRWRASEGGSME